MPADSPLDRFKAVLGGASRALADEPEVELAIGDDAVDRLATDERLLNRDVGDLERGTGCRRWREGDRRLARVRRDIERELRVDDFARRIRGRRDRIIAAAGPEGRHHRPTVTAHD